MKYRLRKVTDGSGYVMYYIERRLFFGWDYCTVTSTEAEAVDLFKKYLSPKEYGLRINWLGQLLKESLIIEAKSK